MDLEALKKIAKEMGVLNKKEDSIEFGKRRYHFMDIGLVTQTKIAGGKWGKTQIVAHAAISEFYWRSNMVKVKTIQKEEKKSS